MRPHQQQDYSSTYKDPSQKCLGEKSLNREDVAIKYADKYLDYYWQQYEEAAVVNIGISLCLPRWHFVK